MTELTELLLALSWESRSCSTGNSGHMSPACTGESREDNPAAGRQDHHRLSLEMMSSRKKMSVLIWKRRGLWHSRSWGNGVNPLEDMSRGSKHNCSPLGPCTGHQEPFLTERLLNTEMRCSGGWGDLYSWLVWRLLSRFPSAGMKVTGWMLDSFHRPGSLKVFTPLWLEERER